MKKEKVKILFWGDAVIETGFARVLHSIARHLPSYYDISWIGVNYFGDPHKYPYRIYPAVSGASIRNDVYGINRFESIAAVEKPDVIFIVNDAWVQNSLLDAIKKFYKNGKLPRIVSYVPIDAEDHDPDWYTNFDIVEKVVAYTEFGKREIIKASSKLEDKLSIIPHGVDSDTFYQLPGTKDEIKHQLYPDRPDFYNDSFITLCANRNQPRKRIDISMKAFKLFSDNKPENVKLYLHMGIVDSHINIEKMSRRLGIDKRLIVTNMQSGVQHVPIEKLNVIYNATDVGLNTSVGEGFSLTNIEHAVTGAPQVVAGHSALRELYSDCGLVVPTSTDYVLDNIMTTGYLVTPEDVAERLEALYMDRGLYSSLSLKGQQKFTSDEYKWENIAKQWIKLFEGD